MPPQPKHNWPYLYDVYKKLCEERPDTSYAEFARQNGVGEVACRSAFNRFKKKGQRGQSPSERAKKERSNERTSIGVFDKLSSEEASVIVKQISSPGLSEVCAEVLGMLFKSLDRLKAVQAMQCEKNEDGTDKIKVETTRDIKDEYQAQKELIYVLREIVPFLMELSDRAGLENIISNLLERKYDITQAALEISKMGANLPEALKIMLSKTPPIMIANNFEMTSTDELDARALETLKQVKWQHECFRPERQQEVIEMKKELKDIESFGPGKEDPEKEEPGES